MLNKKGERELAYIVKVDEIRELPGYDRVESARINGWWCIVPKGQFDIGSLGVYFEIDSLVDAENPAFKFMEKRNYRVKTQRMCKSISQGLLMHPSDFGWTEHIGEAVEITKTHCVCKNYICTDDDIDLYEGDFVTRLLNIKYYEPEDNVRKAPRDPNARYKAMAGRHPKIFANPIIRRIYKTKWGKKLLLLILGGKEIKKRDFPAWVVKTDEERVQNIPWILKDTSPWIATEKIDGTSTTFTMKRGKLGKMQFYVCSRNVVFDNPDKKCFYETNVYHEMAEKYGIEGFLKGYLKTHPCEDWVTLQGETYGNGVQKRDYGKNDHDFAGFNFITSTEGRWNSLKAAAYLRTYGIPWVPIVGTEVFLPETVEDILDFATGKSAIDGEMREGIVFRSADGKKSFKAVSNEYLLKYH